MVVKSNHFIIVLEVVLSKLDDFPVKFQTVQKYYTKRIIGMSDLQYEDILRALKLPSLGYRRVRGDMIEVFKITHGFYDTKVAKAVIPIYIQKSFPLYNS